MSQRSLMLVHGPQTNVVMEDASQTLTKLHYRIETLRKKYGNDVVITVSLEAHVPNALNERND